jgi:hypothetical protein
MFGDSFSVTLCAGCPASGSSPSASRAGLLRAPRRFGLSGEPPPSTSLAQSAQTSGLRPGRSSAAVSSALGGSAAFSCQHAVTPTAHRSAPPPPAGTTALEWNRFAIRIVRLRRLPVREGSFSSPLRFEERKRPVPRWESWF